MNGINHRGNGIVRLDRPELSKSINEVSEYVSSVRRQILRWQ